MAIGERKRHRHLAVRLLAKLPAVLVRYTNRVLPLFGNAGVVNDPSLDRSVSRNLRQHHLAYFGQHIIVRPSCLTDKMQQRLMLCRGPTGSRDRRHRLHALALSRHHQASAIVVKRTRPIRVTDYAHKLLNIAGKTQFNVFRSVETHPSPLVSVGFASILDSKMPETATF